MTTPTSSPAAPPGDADTRPALTARGLRRRFGATVAVDGVDLAVGPHEAVCLVGPSGCGKSTVLRMLAGLVRPDAGEVRLGDRLLDGPGSHLPPERRGVGIVFQDHALFPNLTVADNVAFGLHRADRAHRRRRTAEMLGLVALERHADRYPHELSGGERQRVALARALAPAPGVLLLDEPFASLDPNLRAQLRADVASALRATGTPAVFVTHDQLEAMALGDTVVVLRDGRVEQAGPPAAVFHRPASRFVAAFMGEADLLPATVEGGRVACEVGERSLAGATPSGSLPLLAVVRPDDLVLVPSPVGAARVERVEFQGSWLTCEVRLPSGAGVRVRCPHQAAPESGGTVDVALAPHVDALAVVA